MARRRETCAVRWPFLENVLHIHVIVFQNYGVTGGRQSPFQKSSMDRGKPGGSWRATLTGGEDAHKRPWTAKTDVEAHKCPRQARPATEPPGGPATCKGQDTRGIGGQAGGQAAQASPASRKPGQPGIAGCPERRATGDRQTPRTERQTRRSAGRPDRADPRQGCRRPRDRKAAGTEPATRRRGRQGDLSVHRRWGKRREKRQAGRPRGPQGRWQASQGRRGCQEDLRASKGWPARQGPDHREDAGRQESPGRQVPESRTVWKAREDAEGRCNGQGPKEEEASHGRECRPGRMGRPHPGQDSRTCRRRPGVAGVLGRKGGRNRTGRPPRRPGYQGGGACCRRPRLASYRLRRTRRHESPTGYQC